MQWRLEQPLAQMSLLLPSPLVNSGGSELKANRNANKPNFSTVSSSHQVPETLVVGLRPPHRDFSWKKQSRAVLRLVPTPMAWCNHQLAPVQPYDWPSIGVKSQDTTPQMLVVFSFPFLDVPSHDSHPLFSSPFCLFPFLVLQYCNNNKRSNKHNGPRARATRGALRANRFAIARSACLCLGSAECG